MGSRLTRRLRPIWKLSSDPHGSSIDSELSGKWAASVPAGALAHGEASARERAPARKMGRAQSCADSARASRSNSSTGPSVSSGAMASGWSGCDALHSALDFAFGSSGGAGAALAIGGLSSSSPIWSAGCNKGWGRPKFRVGAQCRERSQPARAKPAIPARTAHVPAAIAWVAASIAASFRGLRRRCAGTASTESPSNAPHHAATAAGNRRKCRMEARGLLRSAHKVDMVLFNCRDPLLRFRCDRFEVVVVKVSITGRCDVPPP